MAETSLEHIDVGTVIANTYELTGLIGRGGAGAVWAARHLRLPGKQVAVKVLLGSTELGAETYARFRHEAEIASRLGHPNIVEVLDFNELPSGTPYMVMELLKGESLRDRLQRGPLPLALAMSIARQIGSALHAAHKQHIVHRDLKPANIFLCPYDADGVLRDHVKVLDFGISKIRDSESVHTQADVLMGTPRYMAPEQAWGKNELVDQRTDEFALGAIVYEMLSGRPAFTGEGVAEILMQVVHGKPEPLGELAPELPPHIVTTIDRALEKDATRRFPDIASFIAALTGSSLETFEPTAAPAATTADVPTREPSTPRTTRTSGKVEAPGSDARVPAGILFGDMKGSTEEAELDERASVDKLREYERIVNQTAASFGPNFYKVKTEGDGFMATFATAHAMVECGFAVQREFRQRGWQVRLGGHYGEVYRNPSGDAFGADVNRAARIQSAADASRGQFLVSDAVKAIVRNRLRDVRFEPHPPVAAKGVSEALEVFEVLPADAEQPVTAEDLTQEPLTRTQRTLPTVTATAMNPPGRRWSLWLAGAVVLLVVVTGGTLAHFHVWPWPPDSRHPPILPTASPKDDIGMIAVMEFENQRGDDTKNDWFCKALQTAFNTELSHIPQVSVVAPEIIQRTAKESNLDPMTAARQLGATRFVTGSFAVMGNILRIDARIVDTAHGGVQEAAENVEGEQSEFFSLQKQLTRATLDHFKVQLTAAEQATLNKPTNARLDKYRMLLGAEGVTENAAPPPNTPAGPQALGSDNPASALSWLWSHPAYAQAPPDDREAAVRKVLDEYRVAHEKGDLDALAALYVTFPASQRESLSQYLKGIKQLHVELADVKVQLRDHDAAVSYTRRDNFVDKETGEPVSLEVRVTKFLVPEGNTWKFAEGG